MVIVNDAPWRRTWSNRTTYVHPYTVQRHDRRAAEQHRAIERSAAEREAERKGRAAREQHKKGDERRR